MTAKEIKKAYQKAKKDYEKRTGQKRTWVMNHRQQELGTATIMYVMVYDYANMVDKAQESLDNFDKYWEDLMKDYQRRAREEARKNEFQPGWYFGRNDTYWEDVVADTEKLEKRREEEIQSRRKAVSDAGYKLATEGSYTEVLAKAKAKAEEMIASPEIQHFLKMIGGKAYVEPKEYGGSSRTYHSAEVYIRFLYPPVNE